jgi:hypothetical protein
MANYNWKGCDNKVDVSKAKQPLGVSAPDVILAYDRKSYFLKANRKPSSLFYSID